MANYLSNKNWERGHRKAQHIKGFDLIDFARQNNLSKAALGEIDDYYQTVCRRAIYEFLKDKQ